MKMDRWDSQEWHPGQVLDERVEQWAVSEAVLEQRVPEVPEPGEHDHAREPDLETVQVETVDRGRPAEQKVVHQRKPKAGRDTICKDGVSRDNHRTDEDSRTVREHVRGHGDLVMHGGVGPEEHVQLLVDGALLPPVDDRVEDELVATCENLSESARTSC